MQYLQKRLRTVEGENTSLEQAVSRLKLDIEAASRRASQADQARLETAEKLRNSLRTQEQQDKQMQQIQELNLLRESNVTLRSVQSVQISPGCVVQESTVMNLMDMAHTVYSLPNRGVSEHTA